MTRHARPDLRTRMQKVASKPAQHPDTQPRPRASTSRGARPAASTTTRAAAPRSTRAARAGTAAPAGKPRRARPAPPPPEPTESDVDEVDYSEPEVDGKTRVETLTGWFMWEMVSVPRKRLRYLRELLLGG